MTTMPPDWVGIARAAANDGDIVLVKTHGDPFCTDGIYSYFIAEGQIAPGDSCYVLPDGKHVRATKCESPPPPAA